MFAGKKSAQIREILISESAWEEMTCLFAPSLGLFELQRWLGHSSPSSTQHYIDITPTKLAGSLSKAGYFERNRRMVSVLIDQDAISSGQMQKGEPWRYYDLGHGLCSYDFFEQC